MTGGQGAAGSNPVIPTAKAQVKGLQLVLSPDGSRGYPNGYPDQRDYHRSTCVTTHSPPAFSRSPAWRTR